MHTAMDRDGHIMVFKAFNYSLLVQNVHVKHRYTLIEQSPQPHPRGQVFHCTIH